LFLYSEVQSKNEKEVELLKEALKKINILFQ
jgi:hypothetical protein